ncbi:MAG: DUF2934 domain-containing protein [Candidatus Sulfotelmatobacter sp.]
MTPRTPSAASVLIEPKTLEDQIRRRAFELYEERGREDGHELEDWLRAEEEIKEMQAWSAAVRTTELKLSATPPVQRVRPSAIGAFDAST